MMIAETIKYAPTLSLAATLGRVTALGRAMELVWEERCADCQHVVINLAATPYEIPQIVTF
jgi:hypothetical protein